MRRMPQAPDFREDIPPVLLHELPARAAACWPARVALSAGAQAVAYADLQNQVARCAAGLLAAQASAAASTVEFAGVGLAPAIADIEVAIGKLPDSQREMLMLIAGAGMSYEEAALATDCKIGTVKSRINRGRAAIRAIIDGADALPEA